MTAVFTGSKVWEYLEKRRKDNNANALRRLEDKHDAEMRQILEESKQLKDRVAQLEVMANPEYVVEKTIEGVHSIANAYTSLKATFQYGADRVILWCGHNGGGRPTPGKPFYVTALYADVRVKGTYDLSRYRHITVDTYYVNMLAEVMQKRCMILRVADMEDCQLKSYYNAEGVVESLIVDLGAKPGQYFYASVARYRGSYTESEVTNILLECNKAWNEIAKW